MDWDLAVLISCKYAVKEKYVEPDVGSCIGPPRSVFSTINGCGKAGSFLILTRDARFLLHVVHMFCIITELHLRS